jgi:hypothetical protein
MEQRPIFGAACVLDIALCFTSEGAPMTAESDLPDPPLSPEQDAIVASLGEDFVRKVDCALLSHAKPQSRKAAMLVGLTMMDADLRVPGLPDLFYSKRVRKLVEDGLLESNGNLDYMRFFEVRLPRGSQSET